MLRRRQTAGEEDAPAAAAWSSSEKEDSKGVVDAADADGDDTDGPPKQWHQFLTIRVILFLLVLFALMHLFLWKVVYNFWRDQNHERLRVTVREAIDSLYRVVEHL